MYIVLLDTNILSQYFYKVTDTTRYYTMIFCQRYVHSLITVTQKVLIINLKAPSMCSCIWTNETFRHFFRKFLLSPWGGHPLHPSFYIYPSLQGGINLQNPKMPKCPFYWAAKFLPSAAKLKILRPLL